jgi:hypothetical protein
LKHFVSNFQQQQEPLSAAEELDIQKAIEESIVTAKVQKVSHMHFLGSTSQRFSPEVNPPPGTVNAIIRYFLQIK